MPDQVQSEKSVFLQAIEMTSAVERAAFLDNACEGNPQLRAEVEALLRAHEAPQRVLDAPEALTPTTDEVPRSEEPGSVIGPYKLLQQIGEGGMGVVYMAEQEQPVRRKVALKIIKPGMDSSQVIARFEAERQALALMDHQNIARVLDAGTTDSGRPYFVMELVKGIPITKFCDEQHLTPRERLELFVPVCQAIQHAHQKGIIHRDVKPSNVLVTLYDGKPVPKVIDFGVAKAIEQKLTERTLFTQLGQVVGTVEYMSPEQAELNALDIDTRSDIYSLGVLLYELLTGTTPLEKKRLRSAAFTEMLRMIREEEPPKPSTRLSGSGEKLPSISAQRKTEPAKLAKLVRGELDWIVMKALEKDRGRRYETANGFAQDIERYLADEPVEACPPSTRYRLRKFARKNRKALVTAGAFVLLLVAAVVVSTWQAIRARQAENKARQAQTLAEERFDLAKQAVDTYLNAVTEMPELKLGGFEALRKQLLDAALPFYQKLAEQASGEPGREAARGQAYGRLGEIRHHLEDNTAALADYQATQAIFARLTEAFPDEPAYRRELSRSLRGQGLALIGWNGKPKQADGRDDPSGSTLGHPAEADTAFGDALAIMRQLATDFPSVPEYHDDLAWLLDMLGKKAEAEAEYRTVLLAQRRLAEEHHNAPNYSFQLAETYRKLGSTLRSQGKHAEALDAFRAALAEEQDLAIKHPDMPSYRHELSSIHRELAGSLATLNKPAQAEEERQAECRELQRLVKEYPIVPEFRHRLAGNLWGRGKLVEAAAEFRTALKDYWRLARDHPEIPLHWRELAMISFARAVDLGTLRNWVEQADALGDAIHAWQQLANARPRDPDYRFQLVVNHNNRAIAFVNQGKQAEVESEYRAGLLEVERLNTDHPGVAKYRSLRTGLRGNLGSQLARLGRWTEAESEFQAALSESQSLVEQYRDNSDLRNKLAHQHYQYGFALMNKADVEGAEREYQAALKVKPAFTTAQLALAHLYQQHKSLFASAAGLFVQAFTDHPETANDLNTHDRYNAACAAALAGCGQGEDAARLNDQERARLRTQALDWLRADLSLWAKQIAGGRPETRAAAQKDLQHWLEDSDFAAVRGAGLDKLPEAERQAWRQLWADVAENLARARAAAEKNSDKK